MDEYGQIGPEKNDYSEDCFSVSELLNTTRPVHVALAGVGTQHHLVLMRKDSVFNYGTADVGIGPYDQVAEREPAGTLGIDAVRYGDHSHLFVARTNGKVGCYWFSFDGFHAPGYVAAKLGGISYIDGLVVATFLHRIQMAAGSIPENKHDDVRAATWSDYQTWSDANVGAGAAAVMPHAARFKEATGWDRP